MASALADLPMCSELMQRRERETVVRVPGTAQTSTLTAIEWVCPECDYFEDAGESD